MINISRNIKIFDPEVFKLPVHIIGCGATGSKIALEIAKLGVKNLHLWDFDIVENKNITNQLFYIKDVGKNKVDALSNHILEATGIDCIVHNEKVVNQSLQGIVFVLTDSMDTRIEIFNNCIKYRPGIPYFIETRMGIDLVQVFTVNNAEVEVIKKYESSLVISESKEESKYLSPCGAVPGIGATSSYLASIAVWQFIKVYQKMYFNNSINIEYHILSSLNPLQLVTG